MVGGRGYHQSLKQRMEIALKIQENVSNFKNFSPEALLGTAGLEVIFAKFYNFFKENNTKFLIFLACGATFSSPKFFNMGFPPLCNFLHRKLQNRKNLICHKISDFDPPVVGHTHAASRKEIF